MFFVNYYPESIILLFSFFILDFWNYSILDEIMKDFIDNYLYSTIG